MALLNKLFFPSASATTPVPTINNQTDATVPVVPSLGTATASSNHAAGASATTTTPSSASVAQPTQSTNLRKTTTSSKLNESSTTRNYLSQFPFDGRQVRVLLYKEDDSRGRRLLFDSNALQKVLLKESQGSSQSKTERFTRLDEKNITINNASSNREAATAAGSCQKQQQAKNKAHSTNFIEVCPEYGYKHNRPTSSDITPIGEMVFGSLAMSFRGTALKVHWVPEPARILCSQVYLTPTPNSSIVAGTSGHSPYSTISMNSLSATPRTSICSEQGSMDGLSMNSFSMPFTVSVGRQMSLTPSDRGSMMVTSPLDVPDLQSLSNNSGDSSSGPRFSSTYSNATDSGYSGMSSRGGGQSSSDQWSYQYSTRSSLGSVMSEQSESMRKLSIDSAYFPSSPHLDEFASDGCLQRRISRNLRTSFEYEYSMNDLIGFIGENCHGGGTGGHSSSAAAGVTTGGSEGSSMGMPPNYRRASYCANESRSNPEMGKRAANIKSNSKRAKLGLAVCITMSESFEEEMELFCSEHIALLESMLSRLRACTERAYINHQNFLQIMFQAWQDVQKWFNDLFTAPRIKTPVWLSITTSGSKNSKTVAERFVKELCWLLSFADTKDTNFFISTMLTAILTYHLGWVATVSAFNSSSSARSGASTAAIEQRAKLLQVSQKHPYNALWAQLGDLYGAIGIPPRLARTVIYGTEKLSVERLLNVLTYFIRCGEVRRAAKREDFNKDLINSMVSRNSNEKVKRNTINPSSHGGAPVTGLKKALRGISGFGSNSGVGGGGMTRTQTCKQNLNTITDDDGNCEGDEVSNDEDEEESSSMENEVIPTLKKNEIPNVLAFRDSHFVQQELRIGNYLMDTGIEKKTILLKQAQQQQLAKLAKDGRIRLTITTPDNVVLCMEDDSNASTGTGSIDDGAIEAIEFDATHEIQQQQQQKPSAEKFNTAVDKINFFWNIAPVKEGLSLKDLAKLQQGVKIINKKLERRASSFSVEGETTKSGNDGGGEQQMEQNNWGHQRRASHLSLSDLITQNSMGKSDRMTWGIEPIKENVSLEEQIHFEFCHKLIEREHGISRSDNGNGVVFVLGDNEPLINIKKSTEDLATDLQQNRDLKQPPMLCALHQHKHDATHANAKKHSGMKFNFEQYPQIATNYMKSKNLVMSNYDLLMDKATKLEANESFLKPNESSATLNQQQTEQYQQEMAATSSSNLLQHTDNSTTTTSLTSTTTENCVMCNSSLSTYQTPSNATELEFETDEVHCYQNASGAGNNSAVTTPTTPTATAVTNVRQLHTVSSAASIDTLKSAPHINETTTQSEETAGVTGGGNTFMRNKIAKRVPSQRGSVSSVAAKCAAVNEAQQLLKLPVPGIKELPQEDEPPGEKLRAGFIPSLFLSVSDHYVSDMVLQGLNASPNKWEMNLREDLALSARSASLISQPAENVAIVADMEKWDVRLISSHTQHFPYAGGQSSPVGMSQLVSTMLETVQAMHSGGIPAYECLSYLESKLQEIYLQSETLAAFLLETDFCSLSAMTTALHLSENDVPLLLSIASIHTPKISRKCGISFR